MRVYLQQQLNNSSINDSLIAQPVERRTVNPQVPGSNPGRGATNSVLKLRGYSMIAVTPFFFGCLRRAGGIAAV